MTIVTSRELDVFGVPAHRLAATAGLSNPAGVLVDATPTTRGASMI